MPERLPAPRWYRRIARAAAARLGATWRAVTRQPTPETWQQQVERLITERMTDIFGPNIAGEKLNRNIQQSITTPPPLQGGRQTLPVNVNPFGLSTYNFIWRREYQQLDLAEIDTAQYEAGQLLSILADLSPDVSLAVWNVLRMAGNKLDFQVTTLTGAEDPTGQQLLDTLKQRLNSMSGGYGALLVQLLLTAYLQGAVALDVAPTLDLQDVIDFYAVNPVTIYFQRDNNQDPVPFQRQSFGWGLGGLPFRRLNTELFTYIPLDPYTDDVYGRPAAAPVLQVVFFQTQVLRDLQRVIHAQGWPKIDISVVMDIMLKNAPAEVKQEPQKFFDFLKKQLNDITTAYNGMKPEDAYVHPDYVTVNSQPVGAGKAMLDVQALMQVIRQQIIAALKQLPVLMGEHLGSTETYSTIELTIFARSIDTFRDPVGNALARAFTVALQLMGHAAVVLPQWESIEVYDPLRRLQADALKATHYAYLRDQGWISQDEASLAITGSKAVAPAPLAQQLEDEQDEAGGSGGSGSSQSSGASARARRTTKGA